MEVRFQSADLDRLETDTGFDAGFGQAVVKAFRKRMQVIRAAADERTFYELKSLHFEKLKGDRSQDHSMRLNDQWRLILRFEGQAPNKIVCVVSIEDYH
ncbi:MAG TPA: type II toxin-antitoxin system RelE/ParE family toxin [Polyangiales bacterium]